MITTALLALALQGASHDTLHPAGADYFVEFPDVPALLAAYPAAPMARMFANEEALGALRGMLGDPELTGTRLIDAGLGLMDLEQVGLADLGQVGAASLSLRGASGEGAPYVLGIVDTASEDAAASLVELVGERADWVEPQGSRVVLGMGGITYEAWATLRDGTGMTLFAEQAFSADAVLIGPTTGTVVLRGAQRRNVFRALEEIIGDDLAPLPDVWSYVFGEGTTHFRMALENGRFVSESYSPGTKHPIAAAPWIAPSPANTSLLAEVHPDCLFVAAASYDREGLRGAVADALGVDLTGAPLFDKLGAHAVLFAQPVRGMGLPKTYVVAELTESEGALDDLVALTEMLAADGRVEAKLRKYKKVPYVTLTLPPEISSLGDLGTVRPVITVFEDKLFITNGTLTLKSEIRRRLGEERDQHGAPNYPWTRGENVFGSGATAVVYIDWGKQVEGLFSLARSFGGVVSGMAPDLPFDLTNLPDAGLFTRHMPATIHTVRPEGGGLHHRHEAGFAFETWVGLAGFVAVVIEALEPSAEPMPIEAPPDPRAETGTALSDLRTALRVYMIDHGTFPAELERLVEPTENYPNGYLDGKTTLEPDAWGRTFRYELTEDGAGYRIWSTGADGIDQDGAGDDVSGL